MEGFTIKDFKGEKVEFSSNKDWSKEFNKKSYEDLLKENKEMLEMFKKVLEVNKHHNFNGHLINEQIKQLIKQATQPT